MYLLLVFLPLIGFCLSGLFGKQIGSHGSAIISITCLALSFIISLFSFYEIGLVGCFVYIKLSNWISVETFNVDWGFLFDSLTAIMCCVVTFISFLVNIYSIECMSHDPHLPRFMSYLSLFTFFILTTGITLFMHNYNIGWDFIYIWLTSSLEWS